MIKRFKLAEIKAGVNEVNNNSVKGHVNSIEVSIFDRDRICLVGEFLDNNDEKKSCIIAYLRAPICDEKYKNEFPNKELTEAQAKEISAAKLMLLPWRSCKVY